MKISANLVAALLGEHAPSEQQAAVIEAPLGPELVVAGAGAGKTKTMALRVVWLVANGLVHPDQVLGLTFTKKAAQQLGKKIRDGLAKLAGSPKLRDIDPSGRLQKTLTNAAPTALTYDAFASSIIRDFGLLIPVEPGLRIASDIEQYLIAREILREYSGDFVGSRDLATIVKEILALDEELDNQLATISAVRRESRAFNQLAKDLLALDGLTEGPNKDFRGWLERQDRRVSLLPVVEKLREAYRRRGVTTFHQQMSQIAGLVGRQESVGQTLRRRFRVVMLDEYQDTSHAQREVLRGLFGGGIDSGITVDAVGDPMQGIYSWRGATVANLGAFITDFPLSSGEPAPKAELTTSFRNPSSVLKLANAVSEEVLGAPGDPRRTVSPLTAFGENPGEVELSWFHTEEAERRHIAETMARRYREDQQAGRKFTAAVLVRTNAAMPAIHQELLAHGVPAEIVNTVGLLAVPEVADLVAVATMLVRPGDNAAAMRVLTGPMVGLSIADMRALESRARELSVAAESGRTSEGGRGPDADETPNAAQHGQAASTEEHDETDPVRSRLLEQIEEAKPKDADQLAGLTDAVADPGQGKGLSSEGLRRVRELGSTLRALRTGSLRKPLPELFADIERAMGIRTEVLSCQDPYADGAAGVVHLDKFLEEVSAFAAIPGASLGGLLDYLETARTMDKNKDEDRLASGEVVVRADRVQILTVHKAKGLEWRHVAVAHVTQSSWEGKAESFLNKTDKLPPASCAEPDPAKEFTPAKSSDRHEFYNATKEYQQERKAEQTEEAERLFYVALTRAEETLLITGAEFKESAPTKTATPFEPFAQLKESFPEAVGCWLEDPERDAASTIGSEAKPPMLFPALSPRAGAQRAAEEIERAAATGEVPELGEDELSSQWEADATALIEEHRALTTPVVEVALAGRLTASDLVNLNRDEAAFARRARRPVPFKPNAFAKRGTAFHAWLERRFGGQGFLDEEELPGLDEEDPGTMELAELKELFLAGPWAERTPTFVELPFEVLIGDRVIGGRMDAVFRDPDTGGWIIVDWKTGVPPTGIEREQAAYQLAVYREAFTQLLAAKGEPDQPVRAAFYYVAAKETYEPPRLPTREDLVDLVELRRVGGTQTSRGRAAGEPGH